MFMFPSASFFHRTAHWILLAALDVPPAVTARPSLCASPGPVPFVSDVRLGKAPSSWHCGGCSSPGPNGPCSFTALRVAQHGGGRRRWPPSGGLPAPRTWGPVPKRGGGARRARAPPTTPGGRGQTQGPAQAPPPRPVTVAPWRGRPLAARPGAAAGAGAVPGHTGPYRTGSCWAIPGHTGPGRASPGSPAGAQFAARGSGCARSPCRRGGREFPLSLPGAGARLSLIHI